jgi:hypothetical protein
MTFLKDVFFIYFWIVFICTDNKNNSKNIKKYYFNIFPNIILTLNLQIYVENQYLKQFSMMPTMKRKIKRTCVLFLQP